MSAGTIVVQEISQSLSADTREDVLNGLNLLYSTRAGELSLDRSFGIDWSFADLPTESAKALLSAEVIAKTAKYEPRVAVMDVGWTQEPLTGKLRGTVTIDYV
jgi:phage baseplate assembly protein W